MATTVNFNGQSYSVPSVNEEGWQNLSNYLIELAKAEVSGGSKKASARISTNATTSIALNDFAVFINHAGAATVTLPAGVDGQLLYIGDASNAAKTNNITINPNGSNTILGASSLVLDRDDEMVGLIFKGGNWYRIAQSLPNSLSASSSVTDNGLLLFEGTSGKFVKDLGVGSTDEVVVTNGTTPSFSKITNANVSNTAAIGYSKLALGGSIVNSDINNNAAIAYSKLTLTGAIVNADISPSAAIARPKLALTGTLVNSDIKTGANIAYSKLNLGGSIVNSDINATAAIAYSKLALGNSIVNSDIGNSAAIDYSKLSLGGSIVNSDINNLASIARSKIASGSPSHVVVNDGGGALSSVAVIPVSQGGTDLNSFGSALQILRVNSTATGLEYATVSGTGDVTGPSSSTQNGVVLFASTTGKALKDLGVGAADQVLTSDGTTPFFSKISTSNIAALTASKVLVTDTSGQIDTSNAIFVDESTKASTLGDSSISERHTIYTGDDSSGNTSLASPLQPNGTITFGNRSNFETGPAITGRSTNNISLFISALSFDAHTLGDMYFDIRKDNGIAGTAPLGNPGNIGWRWTNNANTAMTLTRGGALTVGDSIISDRHTFYTGTSGVTAFVNPIQPDGTITFGNDSGGTAAPIIAGRSSDNVALILSALSYDSHTTGDMFFDIRKDDGAGGTTALGNTGNIGWKWRNFTNSNAMTLTRGGALTVGNSNIPDRHTFYTGTSVNTISSPEQDNGTIVIGNKSNIATVPSITGHSNDSIPLLLSSLSWDGNIIGDMVFDIRKSFSTSLGNTSNIGWKWSNHVDTAMQLTRGGALTVGNNIISDRHTIYTGTASTALASLQPNGTITFGNFLSGSAVPTLIGRSSDSVALILSALSWDANTFGDMYFDIRKPDGFGGSTALGNTGNVGWRWRNFGTTAMSLTRGGALTVGDGNISDRHTFYTGDGSSETALVSPLQPNGTITFGSASSSAVIPTIVGRSSDSIPLLLSSLSWDGNTSSDMIFDIRKDDGAGGTTGLGNTGNIGWAWKNFSTTAMTLTRGGALTVGPSGFDGPHTFNGKVEINSTLVTTTSRPSVTFPALKYIDTTDNNISVPYLLLAEAYDGAGINANGFEGDVFQLRGNFGQLHEIRKEEVFVNACFTSNLGGIISGFGAGIAGSSLVTADYNGTKYIALKMAKDYRRNISVKGTIWGTLSLPILVADGSLISNEAPL